MSSRSRRASLPRVVVLPAPCSPASRITAGGCVGEIERRRRAAHQRGELALDDADQRLSGRQRADDVLPTAFSRTRGDEILDDRQRDVGLEQRHAHFAQRVLDVGVGEPRFAAQRLDDAAEPLGQIVEHGVDGVALRDARPKRRRDAWCTLVGQNASR